MFSSLIPSSSIAFDIDGVVADTMRLFIDIAKHDFNIVNIRKEDMTEYDLSLCLPLKFELIWDIIEKILSGNHSQRLFPIDGAIESLLKFTKPVLFVTARPSDNIIRTWFSDQTKGHDFQRDIIATGDFESKASILKQRGITHFVEDRLETCFLLQNHGITPILFEQPWNRKQNSFIRVSSWKELDDMIDFKS